MPDKEEVDIEVNSLEDLLNFVKEWGPIVLRGDKITIYDDRLE
jgi:hypothetical protein